MDPYQALDILDQLTPNLQITLPQHRLVVQALDTLRSVVDAAAAPVIGTPEPPVMDVPMNGAAEPVEVT